MKYLCRNNESQKTAQAFFAYKAQQKAPLSLVMFNRKGAPFIFSIPKTLKQKQEGKCNDKS